MDLLDREQELEALDQALRAVADGAGRVALVTGEAGIGKTSLIRSFLDRAGPECKVLRGACEDLGVAEPLGPLRDMFSDTTGGPSGTLSGPREMFDKVIRTCRDSGTLTILVIEDVHWADDATVDFIRFFARRIVDHPILLIVTSRAEQAGARKLIRRAFGDIPSEILRRIPLDPLSLSAVRQLCAGRAANPERVFEASGGNAFFVNELVQNGADDLPPSIRDAVLARSDRLDPDAQNVLSVVSVIPGRARLEDLNSAAPDLEDPGSAVERCLDSGLLISDGRTLSFTHELARQAVLSALSPLQRRDLHTRLLRHLSDADGIGLSRLLHHAQGASDMRAVADLAPRAARAAAAMGSRREAAAFFAVAVETAGPECDANLLEEAAWSTYLAGGTGEHSKPALYQRRAIEQIDAANDPLRKGDGLRKLARYCWLRSDYAGAFEAVNEAIAVLRAHRGPELALAYSSLSQLLMTGYRHEEVEEPARLAMDLAREFDRPEILSHALNNLAMSLTHTDKARARELLAESLRIGYTLDDPDHAARALGNWMHLEFHTCDYRSALERAEISAAFSRDHEMNAYYRYAIGMMARARHQLGQWGDVAELASGAFDPEDRVPENYNFNGAIALLMQQVRTGAPPDRNVLEYLLLYDRPDAEPQRIGFLSEILAEQAWLSGEDTADAIRRLNMVVGLTQSARMIGGTFVWLKRLGQTVDTVSLAGVSEPYRIELEGDHPGAAEAWADLGSPYEQAMALAFGSDEDKARAVDILRDLHAGPALSRLKAATIPGRNRRGRPPASGPHGLTKRQLDVLTLLGEGLTNAQIGETLFISPKTVDHHVSAILDKIGATSRGEAAAKARKSGLI